MNFKDFNEALFKRSLSNNNIEIDTKNCNEHETPKFLNLAYDLKDFIVTDCEMRLYERYNGCNVQYSIWDDLFCNINATELDRFVCVKITNLDFIDFINKVYDVGRDFIFNNKEKVDMPHFYNKDNLMSRATGFMYPLCYWSDSNNNIIDKDPYIIFKLSDNLPKNILEYLLSVNLDEKMNEPINFTPILHFKSLYFNNHKCTLIIEITNIKKYT